MKPMRECSTLLLLGIFVLLVLSSVTSTATAEGSTVVQRGESVTITVLLLQNGTYGNPVPEQLVEFFDQTHNIPLGNDTTASNGIASIEWAIPLSFPLGSTLVNATFRGNELLFLSPSAQWITLKIISSVILAIQHETGPLAPGDSFSFSALLLDDGSTPIADAKLIAFSGNTMLGMSITNSSGIASFTLHCNDTWSVLGENVICIVHELNLVDCYASTDESFIVDIRQLAASIDVENHPTQVTLGDTLCFELGLSCSEGGISAELGVFLDDTFIDTVYTDVLGTGMLFLTLDSRFVPGMSTFEIVYNGTARYASSVNDFELSIVSPALVSIWVPSVPVIGRDAEIEMTVLDCLGRPFRGTYITVLDASNGLNTTLQFLYGSSIATMLFPILGPAGQHNLLIELQNRFITNDTCCYSMTVWSAPLFLLQECNILHYASPNQELLFAIGLADFAGSCSYRNLTILINDFPAMSASTNPDGIASLTVNAPESEGAYSISFLYGGNVSQYELSTRYDYELIVSRQIPVRIEMSHFEVLAPLQEVAMLLRARCLNGSLPVGITVKFIWLLHDYYVQSQEGGVLTLHMSIPPEGGYYSLNYEVEGDDSLSYSSGSIEIPILQADILASQGVGIVGFAVSLMITLVSAVVPLIKQKHLNN